MAITPRLELRQAQTLVRHMVAPVETADLLQAGLVALTDFACDWEADQPLPAIPADGLREAARAAVLRGMQEELRQMEYLSQIGRAHV